MQQEKEFKLVQYIYTILYLCSAIAFLFFNALICKIGPVYFLTSVMALYLPLASRKSIGTPKLLVYLLNSLLIFPLALLCDTSTIMVTAAFCSYLLHWTSVLELVMTGTTKRPKPSSQDSNSPIDPSSTW